MIYLIDAVEVVGHNWRHYMVPAPQNQRVETFPGFEGQITVDGVWQPDDLVITGMIRAEGATRDAAVIALQAVIRTYSQMRHDGTTHTVNIYSTDWTFMKLRQFVTEGELLPTDQVTTPGNMSVMVPVRYTWIQLFRGAS